MDQHNIKLGLQSSDHVSMKRPLKGLAFIVPSFLIIMYIWLPFGFTLTGLIEEWGLLGTFVSKGLFFIADPNGNFASHALRPLTIFPHAIAYFLDPDSFKYWHFLLITALLIKGMSTSVMLWQATGSLRWAIIAGVLVLVYPADTMQLSFRGLHINFALSLLLLSSSLFIAAFYHPKKIVSYMMGFIAAVLLDSALSMYETSFTLIMLTFLMIVVKEGFQSSCALWWKRKSILIIWGLSVALFLAYVVFTKSHMQDTYQQELITQSFSEILHDNALKLLNPGLVRSILGGWFDAFRIFSKEFDSIGYLYLLAASIFLFCVISYIIKKEKKIKLNGLQNSIALIGRLALAGLLISILGFSPYLFSTAHLVINQRTYLFATVGAVFFWIAVLMIIAAWQRIIALCLAFILIVVGLGFQLFQFHHYMKISETQRTLIRNIIASFEGKLDNKTLLILDSSNQLMQTWMFPQSVLRATLTYFYGHPVAPIEICQLPGNEWRSEAISLQRTGTCIERDKDWIFKPPSEVSGPGYKSLSPLTDKIIAKDSVIKLIINPDGSIPTPVFSSAYRDSLNNSESHQAKRYRNILSPSTWANHFTKLWTNNSLQKYRWSFGNWWSMELPIPGIGWREAEWNIGKFFHYAAAWKNQENARIIFNLLPQKPNYLLEGKFDYIINESIRESIQISINNQVIPFELLGNGSFKARIPENTLLSGSNIINFYSKTDPSLYGLSLRLAWFEIAPG